MDFNNRKYDLMVTTTIIESGIDMPNVNTMIVRKSGYVWFVATLSNPGKSR